MQHQKRTNFYRKKVSPWLNSNKVSYRQTAYLINKITYCRLLYEYGQQPDT